MGFSSEVQRPMLWSEGWLGHSPSSTGNISGVKCSYFSHTTREHAKVFVSPQSLFADDTDTYLGVPYEPYLSVQDLKSLVDLGSMLFFSLCVQQK